MNSDDRALPYLDDASPYDLSKFLKVNSGADDVAYTDFLDQAGADKFNRIEGLLGNGGKLMAPTQAGAQFAFDAKGAKDYLQSTITGRRSGEEQKIKDQMMQIQAAAEARAKEQQNKTFDVPGLSPNTLASGQAYEYLSGKGYEAQTPREKEAKKRAIDATLSTAWGEQDKSYVAPKEMGWKDALSAEEASQLNQYAQQTGGDGGFSAGVGPGDLYNRDYFDQNYQTNFERILAELGIAPQRATSGAAQNKRPTIGRPITTR